METSVYTLFELLSPPALLFACRVHFCVTHLFHMSSSGVTVIASVVLHGAKTSGKSCKINCLKSNYFYLSIFCEEQKKTFRLWALAAAIFAHFVHKNVFLFCAFKDKDVDFIWFHSFFLDFLWYYRSAIAGTTYCLCHSFWDLTWRCHICESITQIKWQVIIGLCQMFHVYIKIFMEVL